MDRIKAHFIIFLLSLVSLLDASAKPVKTVAFAQDTMANDFRRAQVYAVRDALTVHPDIHFIYSDANGQTSLLIRQIEQFISSRVDLLIVGTNHADAVVPVVEKAYKSGIPVIILDRGINSLAYTTFINSDNIKIGEMGADYVARRLGGKGQVLLFEGLQEADVTQLRNQGFLKEIAKYSKIKVIRRTGNYLRKDAIIEMEKLVKEGVRIDAIFSESDSMLSGVRSVLQRYDIDPASIITVGCDYTSEAREAILSGAQTASILFSLGGKESADVALKILAKEKVPKHISIPVKLITRDNAGKVPPIF
jgi:ribose transport system substrate-binding protein